MRRFRAHFPRLLASIVVPQLLAVAATAAPVLTPNTGPSQQWARSEIILTDVGSAGVNPYDPDAIAVDADVTAPDGRHTSVPLFWYVGYERALKINADGRGEEVDTPDPNAAGEWRLRWTPRAAGRHMIGVTVRRGNELQRVPPIEIDVAPPAADARGFVSVEPSQKRYFRTDDGRPLPLFGMNACWPGKRQTFDYDDWLPAMSGGGMNYTRLWQGNAGFRCELYADERLNYNQTTLWQLDYVFDLAAKQNIDVMLCMGFHGEFQTKTDAWGHGGWWATHAYQTKNGGPCERPNDFFTDPTAVSLYRKRLRYLVARYGANPNLFSWQFFNEIDNTFAKPSVSRQADREANALYPADVIAWHDAMSRHLRSIDPFGHLVTTSFGSAEEYPDMWRLPGLDYANWHWYTNWGGPFKAVTEMTAFVGKHFGPAYDKPVVIAEFGTDGHAWGGDNDAERRGLRQAIWGAVFAGTAGTAMPWFWEDVHRENLYPLWKSLRDFLPDDFGSAKWKPVTAFRPAPPPPPVLRKAASDAARFSQRINFSTKWGKGDGSPLVIDQPGDDSDGRASGYMYGRAKPEFRARHRIHVNAADGATLVLHLNSVSADPVLVVRQNGDEIFRRELPNKDGKTDRNNEYNENITIPLRAGRAELEIANEGVDWLFLDWVRVDGALEAPATDVAPNDVPLERYVMTDGRARLIWIVDSRFAWPRSRTKAATPLTGSTLTLDDWPDGPWDVQWWHPRDGRPLGTARVNATGGKLSLLLAPFSGDLAAQLTPAGSK